MKKTKVVLLISALLNVFLLLVIVISISTRNNNSSTDLHYEGTTCTDKCKQTDNNADKEDVVTTIDNEINNNSATQYQFNIDINCAKEYEKAYSNAEKVNVVSTYDGEWKTKIDLYYQAIIDYYTQENDTDMVQRIEESQENWQQYANSEEEIHWDFLESRYGPGTIVPIKQSTLRYCLHRDRAIYLYTLCLQLFIDVEAP